MKEQFDEGCFSDNELNSLNQLKSEILAGARTERNADFIPRDPLLFSKIQLYMLFPGLADDPEAEKTLGPKEKIIDLVGRLDDKIVKDPKKFSRYSTFDNCEVSYKTDQGAYVKFHRSQFEGKVSIRVIKILELNRQDYPYIESEEFSLNEQGSFFVREFERYSPFEGCRTNTIAVFSAFNPEYTLTTEIKLRELEQLVDPYLSSE